MTSKSRITLAVVFCAVLSSGCMALVSRTEYGVGTRSNEGAFYPVYSGVAQSATELFDGARAATGGDVTSKVLVCLDVPLTVVMDTVLLPLDLAWWAFGWSGRERK
jgi:uncharacterized protein YceK